MFNSLGLFMGASFVSSSHFVDHHRGLISMCRSKRKRIIKKWTRNKRNWREWETPKKDLYMMNGMFYGHPETINQLREVISREMLQVP